MKSGLRAVAGVAALVLLCCAVASARQAAPQDPWPPPGVYIPGQEGVTPARLIWDVKPVYTAAAMRARIEGIVLMHCVVNTDGTVGAVRVFKSLDAVHGLDASAVQTLKQWRFAPGTKGGVAVPVLVFVEMKFTLRDGPAPPLEWPGTFVAASATTGWAEREVETPDIRVRVSYPVGWHVHTDDGPNGLLFAHDHSGGRAVAVLRARPTTMRIDRQLSKAELRQAIEALKPKGGARGSEVTGAGQVEIANRLWFWIEAHLPTFDPANASLPPDLAEQPHWETGRLWIFTATVGSQMIQVSATLLYPRGMTAPEMEEQTRQAGADFAAILERISITPR